MTNIFCFCLAFLFAVAPAAAEFETWRFVKGWKALYDDARQSCAVVGATGTDGTLLAFSWRKTDRFWRIDMLNDRWKLNASKYYFANVFVDKDFLFKRQLVPKTRKLGYLRIWKNDKDSDVFPELNNGRRLIVFWGTQRIREDFSLYGSAAALGALAACAKRYNNSPRRAPAPVATERTPDFIPFSRDKAIAALSRVMKSVDIEFRLVQQKTKSYRIMFESEKSLGFFYAASRDRRDADTVVGIETSLEQRNCAGDFSSTVKRVPTTDGTIVRVLDGYCKSETSGLLITTTTVITQWPRRQTTSVLKTMSASKAGRKIQERVNKGKGLTL